MIEITYRLRGDTGLARVAITNIDDTDGVIDETDAEIQQIALHHAVQPEMVEIVASNKFPPNSLIVTR